MMPLSSAGSLAPEKQVRVRIVTHWLKVVFVGGIGAGGCMAIVLSLMEAMERDPKEAFALLRAWGPWALVVSLSLYLIWKIVERLLVTAEFGVSTWASSAKESVLAQNRTADALSKLADQGGKSAEETRRLTVYAAQEFPSLYERFDRQDEVLKKNGEATASVAQAVQALHRRLDEAGFSLRKDRA